MGKTKLQHSNFVISEDASLGEAMLGITANRRGTVAVVNNQNHLVGIVSDGDIRRTLLKGAILQSPIGSALNHNPIFILSKEKKNLKLLKNIFNNHPGIQFLPVVDEKNQLVDFILRTPDGEQ